MYFVQFLVALHWTYFVVYLNYTKLLISYFIFDGIED